MSNKPHNQIWCKKSVFLTIHMLQFGSKEYFGVFNFIHVSLFQIAIEGLPGKKFLMINNY